MYQPQRALQRSIRSITLLGAAASLCAPGPVSATERALEEVIVTARKREENLQQVPAAVNVLTADALKDQQIEGMADLQNTTPNVTMMETGGLQAGALAVFIRGIGNDPGFDPGVGIYLDDVYLARQAGLMMDIYDVERIEILKGPQGNLYGRNTIGGAIKYVTREPDENLTANAEARVGAEHLRQVKGNLSGPLVDGLLYGSAGVAYKRRDGFQRNLADDREFNSVDSMAYRVNLKWTPLDNVSAKFMYNYTYDNPDPRLPSRLAVDPDPINAQFNKSIPPALPGTQDLSGKAGPDKVNTTMDVSPYYLKTKTAALTLEWAVTEAAALKSVSAYRVMDNRTLYDFGNTADAYLRQSSKGRPRDISQEFQFTYAGDAFDFVGGIYYLHGETDNSSVTTFTPRFPVPSAGALDQQNFVDGPREKLESYSAYANLDYNVTDRLQVSAGIRGTHDRKEKENRTTRVGRLWLTPNLACSYGVYTGICGLPQVRSALDPVVLEPLQKESWRNYSPTFKLAYDLTPDSMVYASVASGFKSGGLNPSGGFDPEEVRSYAVGYKTTLADNRLRVNTEVFYNDYTDKQFSYVVFNTAGTPVNQTGNVGKAYTRGVDFESSWITPITGLQLDLNVGYLESHLEEFEQFNPATGVTTDAADYTRLGFSPRWTVSTRLSYLLPLGDAGDLTFNADANYRSWQYTNTPVYLNDPLSTLQRSPDHAIVNASIVFKTADGHWRYAVEAKNLTDKRVINNTYAVTPFIAAGYNDPFTWAVSVGYVY